jgi:two-component system KDP operon response regulator KdpE
MWVFAPRPMDSGVSFSSVGQLGGGTRVLVVDDEHTSVDVLTRALGADGFDVRTCGTAQRARRLLRTWQPDVVLLDLALPDGDGEDVVQDVRARSDAALLIVTRRDADEDRIAGLDGGADDYVVKPCSAGEVVSRIRAVQRRRRPRGSWADRRIAHGPIVMDLEQRRVSLHGEHIELSKKEFELLRLFLERPGIVVRRGEVSSEVWGATPAETGKTIDVHVSWLRHKLGDDAQDPRYIETVRGVGFRLKEPEESRRPI